MSGQIKKRSADIAASGTSKPAKGAANTVADMVLIDRHLSRYTYMVDARRYGDWTSLFTPDGMLEHAWQDEHGELHEVYKGAGLHLTGRKAIAAYIRRRHGPKAIRNLPRPAAGVGHRLVNRIIDVAGDTASVHARGPEGNYQYQVTLRRTASGPDGGWKFTRVFIIFNEDHNQDRRSSP